MILRLWAVFTVVIVAVAWYLTVIVPPVEHQATTSRTLLEQYRTDGLVPEPGHLVLSDEIGHETFDIPKEDAIHLAAARRNAGDAMEESTDVGMTMGESSMGEMDMGADKMVPMTMTELPEADSIETATESAGVADEDHAIEKDHLVSDFKEHSDAPVVDEDHPHEMASVADEHGADHETSEQESTQLMPGLTNAGAHSSRNDAHHGETAGGHGSGGIEVGISILAEGSSDEMPSLIQGIHIDHTATIAMHEWGYDPMSFNVGVGDVVKLVISHKGSIPHEFMLMGELGMEAVNYRLERADWNLLEHEAIFERSIVMPGEVFELVVKIHKPGMYMYMCMFPKHMQFGMMGMVMAGEIMM